MNRTTEAQIIRLFFAVMTILAVMAGLLVAIVGAKVGYITDADGFFSAWLIVSLLVALVFLIGVIAFLFPAFQSAVVGAVELQTGRNYDKDPRIGNGLAPAALSSERKNKAAKFWKPNGHTVINGVDDNELLSMLIMINNIGGMPERAFLGNGKMFSAGERSYMEQARARFAELGILAQRASDGAYVKTEEGEGLIAYHVMQHNKRGYAPSPTAGTIENWS